MAKYTIDFKLSVIEHYLNGHSYNQTAKHFGLVHKTVELWVKLYQTHGIDGIKRRNTKAVYDTDFKLNAVQELLAGKSLTKLAIELNISNPALLSNWLNSYQSFGIMGLEPKPKGRKAVSNSNKASKTKSNNKPTKADKDKSRDELLDELLELRVERDVLKKLIALTQHKTQKPAIEKKP